MTELQREPMHVPRSRGIVPPPPPRVCQQCGAWPATRIAGPQAADRLCETCAKEDNRG